MSTVVPINIAVGTSATDLYTSGADPAQMTTLLLTNTTDDPITVDVWKRNAADSTSWFLGSQVEIPGHKSKALRGVLPTFDESGAKVRAQASDTGVDAVGSVIEYS